MRNIFLFAFLMVVLAACQRPDVEFDSTGVTVRVGQPSVNGARVVRLDVVTPEIVRVRATAEDALPSVKPSLIIDGESVKAASRDVKVDHLIDGDSVWMETGALRVLVRQTTGCITFYDHDGNVLLGETPGQGKTFEPYTVPLDDIGAGDLTASQSKAWSWRMQFDSPDDESFYGLGQHQSGELDMKGKNEELFQYNTKISVPFVVSTRGYGLLWDSYSLCRWGNPNEYRQLGDVFKVTLQGEYTNLSAGMHLSRNEDSLYYENSATVGNLPKGFPLNGASVIYRGTITPTESGTYDFMLYYAGYARVWMDEEEVVPTRWRTAWNPNAWKFAKAMVADTPVQLRIEWQPDGDVSYMGLRVASLQSDEQQCRLSVWSEMSRQMDYYFIKGETMDNVIAGYRTLTGKAQVMPRWAMGFWQSRERYKTQDELVQTLAEFRRRHIPIDNIVQDWFYWSEDQWGSHCFDADRYPDPQAMLDAVHDMHARYMISVWPKFYCNTDNYKELDAHGWMYRQAVKDSIRDWVGEGHIGSFYDAYAEGARKIFWRQMNENLFTKYNEGIDAWWMDASEPNVRDCTPIGYRKALCGPTALGSSTEYFNAYSLVNAMAIYNGQRSVNPDRRVFLLTRSGFAGLQRYSTASWSGDIGTRWEDMRAQMTAGMNYSMAGIPFWGMDIGGFCVENRYASAQQEYDQTGLENDDLREWRELQARWTQFGCFVPLYRTHGQWPAREVWNIAPQGHPAYESIVWYHRLRYHLMPYLYSMAGWVHLYDYTLMRALVMDFGHDYRVRDIKDQWMFGPSLMACPVAEYGVRRREVYLPLVGESGGWYDLYSGSHYAGGATVSAAAPYERIPVFVPEGAIIPFGPAMEWSDQQQADTINLYVYTGRDAEFRLYEDENTNYNYERGEYAEIPIAWNESNGTLTIAQRRGAFNGMLQKRRFNVVFVSPDSAKPLVLDSPSGRIVEYAGEEIVVDK